MKSFVLSFLVLLVCCSAGAQNYTNICSPGSTLFSRGNDVKGFRYVTLSALPGPDTLFISFPASRDTNAGCLDTAGGSVLGRKIFRLHDGTFLFFNYHRDTILIRTQAISGETWRMMPLPGKSYIQAAVTASSSDTVEGLVEPVKVITLQAKDSAGSNISHIFNSMEIRLGRNLGFTKCYDMYMMPEDTGAFILAGKTSPPVGLQEVTVGELFDFNVGDEFQYTGSKSTNQGMGLPPRYYWKEMRTILSKTTSNLPNSISYEEHILNETLKVYIPDDTVRIITDTIVTVTYDLAGLALEPWFSGYPDEYNVRFTHYGLVHQYYWQTARYNQRMVKGLYETFNTGSPQCYYLNGNMYRNSEYLKGVGETWYKEWSDFAGAEKYEQTLVYYRKGAETWGNPVFTGIQGLSSANPIRVFPNPSGGIFNYISTGIIQSVRVFSSIGKLLRTMPVNNYRGSLNLTGSGKGVYFLKFVSSGYETSVKVVVL